MKEEKPSGQEWRPSHSPWLIALAVLLPTFMVVLDTTIVTVALPHMAGNLSATTEEVTWVVTSYLVSNSIILPASAWFTRFFGRKRFLIACIGIFTASSFLCGAAAGFGFLILARILQGAGGGALQPLAQAILLESFPPARRGAAMAMFGVGVVVAPILGPILGGWITDDYSWRWLFYINIPIGILAVWMIERFVEDPPYIRGVKPGRIDAIGFGLMTVWLATLQIILDKGQQEDWFGAIWLRWTSLLSAAAMVGFLLWELRQKDPIVHLRVFANRNFAVGVFLATIMGVVIYSPLTLLPLFLQNLMGYPALDSGFAQSPRGLGSCLTMPLVGFLTSRVDNRRLIAAGFVLISGSTFLLGNINLQMTMSSVVWPNFVQGIGMSMLFVPLATIAVGTLPNQEIGNASAIFNLVRNIGGSVGISLVTTMLARGAQAHQAVLSTHMTPYDLAYLTRLHAIQGSLAPQIGTVQAQERAGATLYSQLVQQSTMMAFIDDFRWLALLCVLCMGGVFFLKKVPLHGHAEPPAGEAA